MDKCETCKYAEWDYFEYYGTTQKNWFVEDCEKCNDIDTEDCEDYEEREVDYDR